MRSLLALSALAALALIAVPPATATLANPICTPGEVVLAQACVAHHVKFPVPDPQDTAACAMLLRAPVGGFACVELTDHPWGNDICVTVRYAATGAGSLDWMVACIPY